MKHTYVCDSFRNDCGKVYFGKEGAYGWKLDVQYADGRWGVPFGDQVETYLDEILPYLMRFANKDSNWQILETGDCISFWTIISDEFDSVT